MTTIGASVSSASAIPSAASVRMTITIATTTSIGAASEAPQAAQITAPIRNKAKMLTNSRTMIATANDAETGTTRTAGAQAKAATTVRTDPGTTKWDKRGQPISIRQVHPETTGVGTTTTADR